VEAQVALSEDDLLPDEEFDEEMTAQEEEAKIAARHAVFCEALEKQQVQVEELKGVIKVANQALAGAAGQHMVPRLCDEGQLLGQHGKVEEAAETLRCVLALADKCHSMLPEGSAEQLTQERKRLLVAAGTVNMALKFHGAEASAAAYRIFTSPPVAVSNEEAALEREVLSIKEVSAEVCFQRALHEHELNNSDKAMRYLEKAVRMCPDCLRWGGDVGVVPPYEESDLTSTTFPKKKSNDTKASESSEVDPELVSRTAKGPPTSLGWGPLDCPIAYSIALVLLAILECHVAAFGGSLCLLVFTWCKVCRNGNADFFTWVQGLSVLCLLWGLAVLAFLYGVLVWIAAATYLSLGGVFVWLWDSSLSLDNQFSSEGENTTMSVIKRVLAATDHYTTLGILNSADQLRIKEAYSVLHRLLGEGHVLLPDMKDALKKVERAYEVLGDSAERKCYDKLLSALPSNGMPYGDKLWDSADSVFGGHMLACGACGKAHRRIPVDRDPRHARWCSACHCYHEAFIGDGWAETDPQASTSIFTAAFTPTEYYVCMEDGIFQVTEWAQCQQIVIEPNTHRVPFTITTNPQQNGKPKAPPPVEPKAGKKAARANGTTASKKKPKARR